MNYLCNIYYARLLTERMEVLRLAQWSIKKGLDAAVYTKQKHSDQTQSSVLGEEGVDTQTNVFE